MWELSIRKNKQTPYYSSSNNAIKILDIVIYGMLLSYVLENFNIMLVLLMLFWNICDLFPINWNICDLFPYTHTKKKLCKKSDFLMPFFYLKYSLNVSFNKKKIKIFQNLSTLYSTSIFKNREFSINTLILTLLNNIAQ